MSELTKDWKNCIPEGDFISTSPTYRVGEYFDCFKEDVYEACKETGNISLKYYFFDPTENGYPLRNDYPLLIFLHGASNSLVGKTCVNYTGAELFASKEYQQDFQGAYILVPIANEYKTEDGYLRGTWSDGDYKPALFALINEFIGKYTPGVGKKFLLGNSSGASMTFRMGVKYPDFFDALIPVGTAAIPSDEDLDTFSKEDVAVFFAIGKLDEFNDFEKDIAPRLCKLESMKKTFVFTPDWVRNGDRGIASINGGVEMGQHCLMNTIQANLKFDDKTPMDSRLPRGITGWIDEINRGGCGWAKEYKPEGTFVTAGKVQIDEKISLFYEEFGSGDRIILSSQAGFYHVGMHQKMAELGYHVYCITMRGFHPSTLISEDYGDKWYETFAKDVLSFADRMGIEKFIYMGASHGAGIGWHLMLFNSGRVNAFIAVVAGPHSLKEGTMSYRQMLKQGIIKEVPPFDPPIDKDDSRLIRRNERNRWMSGLPKEFEVQRELDYGRPLMSLGTEEKLCEALKTIEAPTLLIGGTNDPISTQELMIRTAGCLPHCKLVIYSNCGHNIDTDLIEEVSDEADRFLKNVLETGKWYLPLKQ